jgi:uncharacterized repeat protein (TIGR02543 family)
MKNKRVFFRVLLTVLGGLCMLGIAGCDNGSTSDSDPTQQYTVTFDANGGQVSPATKTVDEGATISPLPTPKRTDEDPFFQGWYTKNGKSNNDWEMPFTILTPITNNITVYAKWGSDDPMKYIVKFDLDEGAGAPASIEVNEGDPVGPLPTPTKSNNVFGGWWTGQNGGGTQFIPKTVVNAHITVYAKWTVKNNDGGNNPKGIWSGSIPGMSSGALLTLEIGDTTWELKDRLFKGTYANTNSNVVMTITEMFTNSKWVSIEQVSEDDFPSIWKTFTVSASGNILTITNLFGEKEAVTFTKTDSGKN